MNEIKITNLQLLQKLDQKIKSEQILFWIDDQDCYLLEWTMHYCNKIKVGDLSQTKESYFKKWARKIERGLKEREKRNQFLNAKFSEISDVELVKELEKRTQAEAIKLSMLSGNDFIHVWAKDIKCGTGVPLSIEIKAKENL